MRGFVLVLALAASTTAIAADFPVSGAYGTPRGCALFKTGGIDAVTTGGDFFPDVKVGAADDAVLVVSPKAIFAVEMLCEAADAQIEGNWARLTCLADENGPDPIPVTLQEDRSAGTLAYTDADGTLTLRRCES